MVGEASLLRLYGRSKGSRSSNSTLLCDLLLKRVFADSKSKGEFCKAVRCSGTDLALRMDLSIAKFPVSEACHRIFSRSSTMIGGFGYG